MKKIDVFYTCQKCCKENCGFYMLRNDLWEQIWKDSGLLGIPLPNTCRSVKILCWKCAEELLGRQLSHKDLNPSSNCNEIYYILFNRMQEADDYIQGCLV